MFASSIPFWSILKENTFWTKKKCSLLKLFKAHTCLHCGTIYVSHVCKYKLGFERKLRKDAFVIVASDIGKKFQNAWHQKYTTLIAELPLSVGIDYRPRFHWAFSQKAVRFYSEPIKKHLFHFSKTIHLQSFKRVPRVLVIIKSKAKAKVELSHELNTSDQVKTSKWMQDFKFYNMLQSFLVQSSIYSYPQIAF